MKFIVEDDFEAAISPWTFVKQSIEKKLEDWNSLGISVSERWVQVFKQMTTGDVRSREISRVAKLAPLFPGTMI